MHSLLHKFLYKSCKTAELSKHSKVNFSHFSDHSILMKKGQLISNENQVQHFMMSIAILPLLFLCLGGHFFLSCLLVHQRDPHEDGALFCAASFQNSKEFYRSSDSCSAPTTH